MNPLLFNFFKFVKGFWFWPFIWFFSRGLDLFILDLTPLNLIPLDHILGVISLRSCSITDLLGIICFFSHEPFFSKIMSSNPMELQEDLDRFVQWCDQTKMEINVGRTHLMMFRGDDSQKFRMKNVNLQISPFERDLGVVISEDLSWVEQTKTRCNKAYRAFFNLKRNTSPLSSLCSRLNMYCGCVVPILTHCSPVWHANRTSMKDTRTGTEESNETDLQNVSSRRQNPLDPTETVTN